MLTMSVLSFFAAAAAVREVNALQQARTGR